MIASFSKNFLFIRTRKTASTSTEIVLGSWCDDGDVVVPIGVEDELTRRAYGGGPKNFSTDAALEIEYRQAIETGKAEEIARLYKIIMKHLKFHHHMSAVEARALLTEQFWNGATKIAVDRHPYEKAISLAFWRSRHLATDETKRQEFITQTVSKGEYRNFDIYSENGNVIVDHLLRYENLWPELAKIAAKIGTSLPDELPNAKGQHRANRQPAHEILTSDQKRRIYEHCAEEFEYFGYER